MTFDEQLTELRDHRDRLMARVDALEEKCEAQKRAANAEREQSIAAVADKDRADTTLRRLLVCAESWERDARLLGNITAQEIADMCNVLIQEKENDNAENA